MNLVSCSIENFGGLHQRTFNFDAGLTVIEQANGSGKTTLAAFIRCMLYGMPRQKRNDLNKDLRRRYAPWQGGAYGGQLVVHANKRLYRIERSFGASPKEDVLAVYDQVSGRRTDELGPVPGITLFGLDVDSFERSAYIPQNRLSEALATADIKAKLGNLVDNTDATRNYESAVKALRDARAKRVPYRGNGGLHADIVDRITQVSEELSQLSTAEGELERVRDREARLSQAMDERQKHLTQIRADLSEAATMHAQRGLALECKRLDDERTQAQEEYAAFVQRFSGKMPGESAVQEVLDAVQCLDLVKQAGITQAEIDAGAFGCGAAGAADVAGADGDAGDAGAAVDAVSDAGGAVAPEHAADAAGGAGAKDAGAGALEGGAPEGAAGAHATGRNMGAEKTRAAFGEEGSAQAPQASPAGIVLAVAGALIACAGGALAAMAALGAASIFAGQLYVGLGVAAVGVALCVAGGLMRSRSKKRCAEAWLGTSAAVGAGATAGAGATTGTRAGAGAHAGTLAPEPGSPAETQHQEAQRANLARKAAAAQAVLQSFCADYGWAPQRLTRDHLMQLRGDARQASQLRQRVSDSEQAFSQFVEAHGLCAWRRSDEERFRMLNARDLRTREEGLIADQDAALQNHAKDLQRMRVLQERVDKTPQLEDELAGLLEQRKKVEHDAATLDAAMKYLEQAKDQLCATYAVPMQERFRYYLELVMSPRDVIEARNTQVDADFSMTFSHAGATREQASLSAGYVDLVMVCMRMALCDVLYEKEHPFIVMDDPFANVDDEMLQQAYQLIEKLSKDHQIIYLTCSNSRNPQA